jgi:hypothetical protein
VFTCNQYYCYILYKGKFLSVSLLGTDCMLQSALRHAAGYRSAGCLGIYFAYIINIGFHSRSSLLVALQLFHACSS